MSKFLSNFVKNRFQIVHNSRLYPFLYIKIYPAGNRGCTKTENVTKKIKLNNFLTSVTLIFYYISIFYNPFFL
ncbi:MAG: hypothetical protein EA359_07005 [Balneolaceae bacterium]|nr:MAG: hypothetical protein EA359_07005 [Balneolaceae bacterium]